MKKLFIVILFISFTFFVNNSCYAASDDYQTFSQMKLSSSKLLKNYTENELDEYYKLINKRKLEGWRIAYINKNIKANFVSETVFSIYNTGSSAIEYEISTVSEEINKISISYTGSISAKVSGSVKKFKGGLDASLKIESESNETMSLKTTEKFSICVDPHTKVSMYIAGSGYLTTGVACNYLFWFVKQKGAFEYFQITDIYPRIEKVAL